VPESVEGHERRALGGNEVGALLHAVEKLAR
jgi:hypothetical protein